MQEDPIGFAAMDQNLYRYVFNNPINATDPSGLVTVNEYNTTSKVPGSAASAVATTGQRLACVFGGIATVFTVLEGTGGKNVFEKVSSCSASSLSKQQIKQIRKVACRKVYRNGAGPGAKGREMEGIVLEIIDKIYEKETNRNAKFDIRTGEIIESVRADISVKEKKHEVFIDVKAGNRAGLTKNQRKGYRTKPNIIIKFMCLN